MRNRNAGIILVLVLGTLTVLSMIAIVFYYSTIQETRMAGNYFNSARAIYAAEAGIARAISELKAAALANPYDTLNEAWAAGYNGNIGGGSYSVAIEDEQRKININNANLQILTNLLNATRANNIIAYRAVRTFETPEELKCVNGISDPVYNGIADFVTVASYTDSHCSGRSPVNVDTADVAVLQAVFEGISDGINTISNSEASALANHIVGDRSSSPFTGWSDFNASIDRAVSDGHITAAEAVLVKNNCNPNRIKPANYTTELCFNSGGVYGIKSTGNANISGIRVGSTQKQAVVRIFNIFNQTTKNEFMQPWLSNPYEGINFSVGDIVWVTFMDSCPIRSDQNWDTVGYDTIPDSLKLGYWDNFQENVQVWSADHINDWTSWYWGSGSLFVSGGILYTGGGWTLSNLNYNDPYSAPAPRITNCNRWNTGSTACTISMEAPQGIFYFRRWVDSNSDTRIYREADPLGTGLYRLTIMSWAGWEYGTYSYMGVPTRMTLRLNADNTVAAAYMSGGTIGGALTIGYSTKSNTGQVVGNYQAGVGDVRMIPGKKGGNTWNGRYTSTPLVLDHQIRAGTVTGTATIPLTANAASETIAYGFCPDGNMDINGDGFNEPKLNSGDLTNTVQYVVYFSSNDANLYETPVCEDVTATYLDSVQAVYTR